LVLFKPVTHRHRTSIDSRTELHLTDLERVSEGDQRRIRYISVTDSANQDIPRISGIQKGHKPKKT